ncbi:MAG: two-component regulator propeller domain-containing protein, partial [Psychroflexus maritimus]
DSVINFSKKHRLIHPNSKRNGEKSPQGTLEHVFIIAEDNKGNIWFGDRDAGIWKFNGEEFENYTKKDGLKNDFVLSIYEDRNSKLWFGMADGSLYKFNGKTFEQQF